MQHETNHRTAGAVLTTTIDRIDAYRKVTLVERGAVWSDRVIYDSTVQATTKRAKATRMATQPQHRHVFEMWAMAVVIFLGLVLTLGMGAESVAIFAPVIQETFTHWSVS